MGITSKVIAILISIFSVETTVIFMAALPIFELRLAIPVAILKFHFSITKAYFLSFFGNMLPVIPLLLFFKYFFHKLMQAKFIGGFFCWWFESVQRRSKIVEKWGFWGLMIFVAIPLPATGAWTGCVAATLFEMRLKKTFFSIALGVAIAGLIVSALSVFANGLVLLKN